MNLTLSFRNTKFDIADIHGQPWLRGYQIGNALGYTDPAAAISKLFDRNTNEFTDSMTQLIELPTAGGIQKVRVFSLRGCHLLGMLARTKVAKEFRRWVLDILEKEVSGSLKTKALPHGLNAEQQESLRGLHRTLVGSVPKEKQAALAITLWSSLKSKFKVGYKDIDPDHFLEALSLMARVAVEKGAQYREAVNLETVPKLYANQAAIPFNLDRDGHFDVRVHQGRVYLYRVCLASTPAVNAQISVLQHMNQ